MSDGEAAVITAIAPTARDPQRAAVRVGRRRVATLSLSQVEQLGLKVGQPWDEAVAEQVEAAAAYEKAMQSALNRLARRPMSRVELERKLRQRGETEAVRRRVLDRLGELGYLDDEAFARALIAEQLRQHAGPMRLRQKLYQKGVARELAERLIAEHVDGQSQLEQARALVRKRAATLERFDAATRYRRLYSLLARRGYDRDVIESVMGEVGDGRE